MSNSSLFGPNGSHWPSLFPTPHPHDNIANIIEVNCSWDAIKAAIQGLSDAQVDQGVLILVKAGTLTGKGASSGSSPVLENLGKHTWSKRVTIAAKDGFGSLKVNGGTKLVNVSNVCLALWQFEDFNLRACRNSAVAWSTFIDWFGAYGSPSYTTSNNEFCEIVTVKSQVKPGDTSDFYTAGGNIENWVFEGCYIAPTFKPAGSNSHTDTLQFAKTSSAGTYKNMKFVDCALWGSNNCALQTGNLDGMELDHCLIASSKVSLKRYPVTSGGDTGGFNSAFNGSGKNFKIFNSFVAGNVALNNTDSSQPWLKVENTITDRTIGGLNNPKEGFWSYRSSFNELLDIDNSCPIPTDEYLKSIWSEGGPLERRTSSPEFSVLAGEYATTQEVALTCATPSAEIFYSINGGDYVAYTMTLFITNNTLVRAFAKAPNMEDSGVVEVQYVIGARPQKPEIKLLKDGRVEITTSSNGAKIYYTIDGSAPNFESPIYSSPLVLKVDCKVRADVVVSAQWSGEASYDYESSAILSDSAWSNISITASSEKLKYSVKVRIETPIVDSVVGLSSSPATKYADLACIVQFYTDGKIKARKGAAYSADVDLSYEAGKSYLVEFEANLPAKTYSVFVNGTLLAADYPFRTEQATTSVLANFSYVTVEGSAILFDMGGTTPPPVEAPKIPTGLKVDGRRLSWDRNPEDGVTYHVRGQEKDSIYYTFEFPTANNLFEVLGDKGFFLKVRASYGESGVSSEFSEEVEMPAVTVPPVNVYATVVLEDSDDQLNWRLLNKNQILIENPKKFVRTRIE